MNAYSRWCVSISLFALVLCGQAAFAQTYQSDYERLRQQGIERTDAAARAHGFEQQRQQAERERQQDEQRRSQAPGSSPSSSYTPSAPAPVTDLRAQGKELLRLPPLPDDRNVLLGSWRLEGGGQQSALFARGMRYDGSGGAGGGLGELLGLAAQFDPDKAVCEVSFGSGITFTPSSYSSNGVAGMTGGPVAYRSRNKQVIVAIPGDSRANPMPFRIEGPNRIVWADSCVLVRAGAAGANTAGNTASPGNARAGAAGSAPPQVAAVAPAPPRSTLSRPSPEVCRNTLLDQLGKAGINQVRAMSDVRFKDMPIEGKVPNTNNLRIDLRNSACDDPRLKATLYDFDANGMLQSIIFVWERPPGPAPAPIFSERVTQLSRFHSLPPPQSSGRLQADTSLGRLVLHDMPDRNLVLEAYAAK